MKNVNNRMTGKNITTHDFTTLKTMLPHSLKQIFLIIDSMNNVIDLAFQEI